MNFELYAASSMHPILIRLCCPKKINVNQMESCFSETEEYQRLAMHSRDLFYIL